MRFLVLDHTEEQFVDCATPQKADEALQDAYGVGRSSDDLEVIVFDSDENTVESFEGDDFIDACGAFL